MIMKHDGSRMKAVRRKSPWQQRKTACTHHGNRARAREYSRDGVGAGSGLWLFEVTHACQQHCISK